MEKELALVKCKLEIMKLKQASAELNRSMTEDTREMAQCQFDRSIAKNKELTWELEAAH